ncbi:MAG: hypothetical protein KBI07_06625 [Candidatus Atribacteria bacterium]|nr:hypothetical protein [Candidatus Atribacteria bacterium]
MNKPKRITIVLCLILVLGLFLSSCTGVPKTALLTISIDPNPVPYSSEYGGHNYNMVISENNGVGVTLTSIRFDSYNEDEELYYSQFVYAAEIIEWFESNYVSAFSYINSGILHTGPTKYSLITVEGTDDNGNRVEAVVRIDYLPQ